MRTVHQDIPVPLGELFQPPTQQIHPLHINESAQLLLRGGAPPLRKVLTGTHTLLFPPAPAVYRRAFGRNNGIRQQLALGHGAQGRHAANELDEGILHGILGLAVVTQNIDGLHQEAGSKNVFELHGSVLRNYCRKCRAPYTVEQLLALRAEAADGVPRCPACGGIVKPDVVLYEEPLNERTVHGAVNAIAQADLLVVAGTSLAVYPAAGLIDFFTGRRLVIVNRTPTPRDRQADLCIAANVGEVFGF